jgi:hypothetical protein
MGSILKRQRSTPPQPILQFRDRDELQPAASDPSQLWSDVLVEEIAATAKRLRGLAGIKSEPHRPLPLGRQSDRPFIVAPIAPSGRYLMRTPG